MSTQDGYNIEWKNHSGEAFAVLAKLYREDEFTDVTLHCGHKCLRAHRVVLAACSAYLERVLSRVMHASAPTASHTAVVLKDMPADLVELSVNFMYAGVANVPAEKLDEFMALAESSEIRGLNLPSGNKVISSARPEFDQASSIPPSCPSPTHGRLLAMKRKSNLDGLGGPKERRPSHGSFFQGRTGPAKSESSNCDVEPPASVNDLDIQELAVVKTEASEDESWSGVHDYLNEEEEEYYEEEEAEYDVNDPYPAECAQNIPHGIAQMAMERVSEYLWRGWLETSGSFGSTIYFCSECGYKSVNHANARRHERTHTKETPFECPTCGKRYGDKSALYAHSIHVHRISLAKRRTGQGEWVLGDD